ncbi:MAG: hypothetical protein IKD26_06655 [Clostridia bacterium]|nr:hypothetical protein [Clostridia bacterium]
MKKALIILFLALAVVALCLTGCGPSHTHEFGGKYLYDANGHWQLCQLEDCDEASPKTPHEWNAGEETIAPTYTQQGKKVFTCTTCGATKEESIPALDVAPSTVVFSSELSLDKVYDSYPVTLTSSHYSTTGNGDVTAEIRALASEQGFETAHKSDSQDICFVPDGAYAEFIESYTGKPAEAGDFVDRDGKILGQHKGIIHYTIGQRKGLGIALGAPAFVCGKDPETRRVVLGSNDDLFSREIKLRDVNLLSVDSIDTPMKVTARIRSTHKGSSATVVMTGTDTALVIFDEPQRAACAGQSCVFYDGDVVVGGGIIR